MKNSISKLKYLTGLFLIIGLFACEGPPGADGADGADGIDGVDGTDGAAGADGNANVVSVNLGSADITWTVGSYLGRTANTFNFTENAVSQDVIDHGAVLGFAFFYSNWWSLPLTFENTGGTNREYVLHSYALNSITLYAYRSSGVLDPSVLSAYRFIVITDNTVTKSVSSGEAILDKLINAGVDVNDYYEVMEYFGLEY
jgi:hypothetical protein